MIKEMMNKNPVEIPISATDTKKSCRVAVIGGGPAGIATAVQLKRSGLKPVLFEKNKIGGLLPNANWVENYPGFPHGITGPRLASVFADHLARYNLEPVYKEILKAEFRDDYWLLFSDKTEYKFNYMVIATGTRPKTDIFTRYSRRTFYDIASLPKAKDLEIGIIGGGDAAFDYALNLSRHHRVHLFYRSKDPRCLSLLQERADKTPLISIYPGYSVKEVFDKDEKVHVNMESKNDVSKEYFFDYLLIAIGRTPSQPEIVISDGKIGPSRLIFAGDVKNGHYRQTAIAVGDGIKSAMEILFALEKMDT